MNLIDRDCEGYEEARVGRVFNLRRPSRFPDYVVFPENEEQVIKAVNLAREKGLKVTIRSGGHSWAAWSVQPDSILLDLSRLRILDIDAEKMLVTASTCTTGVKLNEALSRHGLMFGGGHCPDVAIGGFLLQGGQGWSCRTWGWACEQIESMRVVMPKGQVVTASRTENADLFWAARGSGPGFFGVVISFTLRLRKQRRVFGSTYIFDTEECYDAVAPWYLDRCDQATEGDLELVMLGLRSEKCMAHLEPSRPLMIIRAVVFENDPQRAEQVLTDFFRGIPMKESKHCHLGLDCVETTIAEEYEQQGRDNPRGLYWTQNSWLDGSNQQVASALKTAWTDLPTEKGFALHYSMGPLRALPKDMCFDIQTNHTFSVYMIAPQDATDAVKRQCEEYMRRVFDDGVDRIPAGQGGTAGIYLGDSDLSTRPVRFMSDDNWRRWKDIRDLWDPTRLFFGYDGEARHGDRWNKNPLEHADRS
ncbi:FAD-binding domain-containing protein [Testicularia cyperi]|uniref:FAD-binding domain-containing protein n=1 Tax=Testicularia cyperi TaxID=1882483 RepID=A0A317XG88_9BASI|nr:FAD-binding domain-containing protein [Testicularia cyperi]